LATKSTSKIIKELSLRLGFMSCGISKAGYLEEEAPRLENWLNKGMHGSMQWMENHFDKRLDTTLLFPGAKSVISVLFNYYPEQQNPDSSAKISKYAYGEDYHYVVKDRFKSLCAEMTSQFGEFNYRCFVDSAPIMERALAAKAGLGWIGKHSLLLSKQKGSFFFIGQIICDLELTYDAPTTDHCGSCTACIDACPTDAIVEDRVVDATKCISYLTIELKDAIPAEFQSKMEGWAFGCDICQDVCPWNRFSTPHAHKAFKPKSEILHFGLEEWNSINEVTFNEIFKKSAVKRTKYRGFSRNIRFLKKTPNEY
jgi:epoxyqueuosine reductase